MTLTVLGLEDEEFLHLQYEVIGALVNRGAQLTDAEDACQEAVCRVLEHYEVVSYPRRLLFLIASRYVVDQIRERKHLPTTSLDLLIGEWERVERGPFSVKGRPGGRQPSTDGGMARAEVDLWVKEMWPVAVARYGRPVLRALLLHFEEGSYALSRRLGVTMGHERAMVSRLLNGRSGQQGARRRMEASL